MRKTAFLRYFRTISGSRWVNRINESGFVIGRYVQDHLVCYIYSLAHPRTRTHAHTHVGHLDRYSPNSASGTFSSVPPSVERGMK